MNIIIKLLKSIPILSKILVSIKRKLFNERIVDSEQYWENRYLNGGNSGIGSYGKIAEYKANVINKFIKDNDVFTVIEFGCGDGNQLALFECQNYIGYEHLMSWIAIVFQVEYVQFQHNQDELLLLFLDLQLRLV